jgi:hypothetical protein
MAKHFEGTASVCAHTVDFRYWDFEAEVTPELEEELTEHAEQRAQECIIEGYHSGELNCLYVSDDEEEEEIRGWWEIQR